MPLLPTLNIKILDGNHLAGTEHRLEETRRSNSQPLPGHALVVLDPQVMLMIDVFPCEDAYAQERSLLVEVLSTVAAKDCWIADRNFCTTEFLFGINRRGAFFIIRQHASTLNGKRLIGQRKFVGKCDGGKVYEQAIEIDDPQTDETLVLRRITVELDEPTAMARKKFTSCPTSRPHRGCSANRRRLSPALDDRKRLSRTRSSSQQRDQYVVLSQGGIIVFLRRRGAL